MPSRPSRRGPDEFGDAVAGLGGDSFAAKEKAIVALGKLGDPRAVPLLKALGDDRLRSTGDGKIIIVDPTDPAKLSDAATGQPVSGVDPDGLDRVIVNNRLRGEIEAALGSLTLF